MKKIFTTSNTTHFALLIARIGIAALMLTHGIPKLLMLLSGAPIQFPPVLGMSAEVSLGLAVFAEVFCSLFILAGFATRLATIPLIITMMVAIFTIHSADPFVKQEPVFQYLLVYAVLCIAGSGKYSIDYVLQKQISKETLSKSKIQYPSLATYP